MILCPFPALVVMGRDTVDTTRPQKNRVRAAIMKHLEKRLSKKNVDSRLSFGYIAGRRWMVWYSSV